MPDQRTPGPQDKLIVDDPRAQALTERLTDWLVVNAADQTMQEPGVEPVPGRWSEGEPLLRFGFERGVMTALFVLSVGMVNVNAGQNRDALLLRAFESGLDWMDRADAYVGRHELRRLLGEEADAPES